MNTMTNARVLILNSGYKPVAVAGVERAFGLLYAGAAKALDKEFRTFDYESWSALAADNGDDVIHTVKRAMKIPRVLVLQTFDRMPRTQVRFSRQNIYLRDDFTCQYCGVRYARSKLNLDHVVPKAQGGRTHWTNIVCSCVKCNLKKGARRPEEAGMKLLRQPKKPDWSQLTPMPKKTTNGNVARVPYEEWLPFVDPVDASYWNTELVDE